MSREITYEPVLRIAGDGHHTLLLLPAIPDSAPDVIREGIARRRVAALTGQCPCGALCDISRQQRRAQQRRAAKRATHGHVEIWHERDCPASDAILVGLIRDWMAAA